MSYIPITNVTISDGTISSGTVKVSGGSIQLIGTSPVSFSTGSVQLTGYSAVNAIATGSIQLIGYSPVSFSTGSVQLTGYSPVNVSAGSVQLMASGAIIGRLSANNGTDIGDVDIASGTVRVSGGSIQLTGYSLITATGSVQLTGTSNVVATNAGGTVQIRGETVADSPIVYAPVTIGGKAVISIPTAMTATNDVVNSSYDVYGQQFVRIDNLNKWSYNTSGTVSLGTTVIKAAPASGTSIYITDVYWSSGTLAIISSLYLNLAQAGGTIVLGPFYSSGVSSGTVGSIWNANSGGFSLLSPRKLATGSLTITTLIGGALPYSIYVAGFLAP